MKVTGAKRLLHIYYLLAQDASCHGGVGAYTLAHPELY